MIISKISNARFVTSFLGPYKGSVTISYLGPYKGSVTISYIGSYKGGVTISIHCTKSKAISFP